MVWWCDGVMGWCWGSHGARDYDPQAKSNHLNGPQIMPCESRWSSLLPFQATMFLRSLVRAHLGTGWLALLGPGSPVAGRVFASAGTRFICELATVVLSACTPEGSRFAASQQHSPDPRGVAWHGAALGVGATTISGSSSPSLALSGWGHRTRVYAERGVRRRGLCEVQAPSGTSRSRLQAWT